MLGLQCEHTHKDRRVSHKSFSVAYMQSEVEGNLRLMKYSVNVHQGDGATRA